MDSPLSLGALALFSFSLSGGVQAVPVLRVAKSFVLLGLRRVRVCVRVVKSVSVGSRQGLNPLFVLGLGRV